MISDKKVMTENQTRDKIMAHAIRLGCEYEVRTLFKKYDDLLRTCKNESERKHISVLGVTEIYKLIGFRGGLMVNDQVIIPHDKSDEKYTEVQSKIKPL